MNLPQIGSTWQLAVHAPVADTVFAALSLAPDLGTATPYGLLGIDLTTAATLAMASIPVQASDPFALMQLAVPHVDGMRRPASKRGTLRSPSTTSSIGSTEASRDECYRDDDECGERESNS
ncbi:MAG: hypothetical protein JNK49_16320, partial [Planctomycetes bacterium]|nr:hypothetical protein [Planctomycetota bacterium]